MPRPGYAWWHLILSTKSSWLPGDPRGFRDHGHRVHSSGDYRQPPPAGEHRRLLAHVKQTSQPTVALTDGLKIRVGQALLNKAKMIDGRVACMCVATSHVHLLIALPSNVEIVRRDVGRLKQHSSHQVRDALPGKLWAKAGKPIRIRSRDHQVRVYRYIRDHARKENAWVWDELGWVHGCN